MSGMRLRNSVTRHWKRWSIGAIAAIVVLVVGVPFVYIHFIEGPAPAPLALSTATTATTAAGGTTGSTTGATSAGSSTVAVDGTWKVSSGSQAGYRIKETLFGQSNTAVGRTSAVTGTIAISGTTVTAGSFSIDMTKVTSDRSQRDSQFQNRIMDTADFPTATFTLSQPIQLNTLPANGVEVTEKATGNLTMHGTTKSVTFTVTARRSGATIQISGSIPITFADWNISNPSGGPATTEDHGILEFLVNFVHA
jgi:polyisoprenoid-binding protein YceI